MWRQRFKHAWVTRTAVVKGLKNQIIARVGFSCTLLLGQCLFVQTDRGKVSPQNRGNPRWGKTGLSWVSEHPNSPKTSGLLMAAIHPGLTEEKEGKREELLHSKVAEMHTKGVPLPKEGRHAKSSDVGSAFWGCPFARDWNWLQHSWMKVTATGQSIVPASLLIIVKPQKP